MTMGFHLKKGTELPLEVPTKDATKFATQMLKVQQETGATMQATNFYLPSTGWGPSLSGRKKLGALDAFS
jgi:hypothetical protein